MMKTRLSNSLAGISAVVLNAVLLCGPASTSAQTITTPCPNRIVSWNLDHNGTLASVDLAGVAPAVNWNNSWPTNPRFALPDNSGTPTTLDLGYGSLNTWSIQGHPGLDANGTANKELVNGYLNSGMAGWGPSITNSFVSLTNIPYAQYDVIVYFSSDVSGRPGYVTDGSSTNYFSTLGGASVSGPNAVLQPTLATSSAGRTAANYALFKDLTGANRRFTVQMEVTEQWGGIAAFQVVESSNVYVLNGPTPASQIVPVGQAASFSVLASGGTPQYQWRHAGSNISGATNATYNIAATVLGQDGDYDVIISNSNSAVTSSVATLTFYTPKSLQWAGNNSVWDTSTAAWTTNGGIATLAYTETDNVLFDSLGTAQPSVSLSGALSPGSIVVSNGSYTFTGGSFAGSGSLRVRNNGGLTVDTSDGRTGNTTIDSGGTLQVGAGGVNGSLASGAVTNNGTLLFNFGADYGYGLPISGSGNITNLSSTGTVTLGNNVTANTLVQSGAGILLLQGSNSLSGGFEVNSGTVWARAADCLGGGLITVNGGSLQLYFGFNFSGTSLSLAGGELQGGLGGSSTFGGAVTLAASSTILVGANNTFTLTSGTGINGLGYSLTKTGNGTLVLNGNNNSWDGLALSAGTVAFNSAANLSVTSSVSGIGNLAQTGSGTTMLSGDNSSMTGNLSVSAGKLLVNTSSGALLTDVTGGALGGTGTFVGSVSVQPGGTLSPGNSIGTLTIGGDLTLGGNMLVEVNKSLAPSLTNDHVIVTGALSNTNNGVVTVNNLGPALVAGDTFKLFSQAVSGGETLSITSPGATWTNNLAVDGTISVLSVGPAIPSYPTNLSFSASGGTLSLSWPSTHLGWILQTQVNALSTGISSNWSDVAGSAGMTATNLSVNPASPAVFFRLRYP
jgi:autotransporter-associated beta strand protein